MNKKSLAITVLFMSAAILLLSGCGVRKKSLLNKLYPRMNKEEVKSTIGKPDEIQCPIIDKKGNVIDIWKYNLATVDENIESRHLTFQLCGWLLFWPLLCFPYAWESPYEYDAYFLKFVNNLLIKWGGRSDIEADYFQK